jgi:hypothetical protein
MTWLLGLLLDMLTIKTGHPFEGPGFVQPRERGVFLILFCIVERSVGHVVDRAEFYLCQQKHMK